MRRMLWRGTAQGYNRFFTELLKEVKQAPERAPEIIERQLSEAEGSSRLWPRDSDLLAVLTESRAYGSGAIARNRLLDVLWEVERRRLRTNKHERLDRPPNLQIEHVMPQSWKRNWPLPELDGQPAELLESRREVAINRLGNLTLVTDRLNPTLSNAAWAKKRIGLSQHSLLAMNQLLVEAHPEVFDESAIAARGEELARHILAVWPGPPAQDSLPATADSGGSEGYTVGFPEDISFDEERAPGEREDARAEAEPIEEHDE